MRNLFRLALIGVARHLSAAMLFEEPMKYHRTDARMYVRFVIQNFIAGIRNAEENRVAEAGNNWTLIVTDFT